MIKLKLSLGENKNDKDIDIVQDELLSSAIDRSLEGIPLGGKEKHDVFNVTVNGLLIDKDFWAFTKLKETDLVIVSPKISSGDSGTIFKQAIIIVVAALATGPFAVAFGTVGGALAVAAVTIATSLILNALIPPPVPSLGEGFGVSTIDQSQMYAISGQSNQMKRLGTVPKIYGSHRVFPNLATTPYVELEVDPATGETIQYLHAIYDFGLGTMQISDLKVGDTPLATISFRDFEYRLVDPNVPDTDRDQFDQFLEKEFRSYKTRRIVTSLSLALEDDGTEFIQFSDENTGNNPQEIILDFVAPRGLYGFSSGGTIGERNVQLAIDFALVGSSDWKPYNDLNFVDSYNSVGGTDVTDFAINFSVISPPTVNDYYVVYEYWDSHPNNSTGTDEQYGNGVSYSYIKPGTRKLLVPDDSRIAVGEKVFYGSRFLGVVESISNLVGPNTEITLDRVATNRYDLPVYLQTNSKDRFTHVVTYNDTPYQRYPLDFKRHELSAAVIVGDRQTPVYGNFKFTPKVAGQYKIRVKRIDAFGTYNTQFQDSITWVGLTTSYKIVPVASTKRHLFLELKIKATNQLNGNIQNLSAIVTSALEVYDPDTETWSRELTDNPAWVFVDLLTGEVNKKAVARSKLHLESLLEWADYCAEVPTSPPDTVFQRRRFACNFILDYQSTLQEVLGQVGGAAQASLNIIDGKYGVLIDKFKNTPVQIFTPRNSKDFSSTRFYGPRPDGVKVKYIDPNLNWEVSETIVYDNGFTFDNAVNLEELTAFACTNNEQAWRFGRYMIAQNKLRLETINLTVDFENLVCTRGDYVQITQDVMLVGGTPARVRSVNGSTVEIDDALDIDISLSYGYVYRSSNGEINTSTLTPVTARTFLLAGGIPAAGDLIVIGEMGRIVYDCIVKSISPNDDMSANIVLVEKADAIFAYESTDVLPDYDPQISNTSKPDFSPPLAVTDLTVVANTWRAADTQSGYSYYVDLSWNIPQGSVYELFELWVDDGRGYRKSVNLTDKKYRYEVDQSRLDIQHGFKVVAVSASGKKLNVIAMTEVLVTPASKTDPPSNVEGLNLSITNQVLQLSWNFVSDTDIKEYELRFSPDTNDVWESSTPLTTVPKNINSTSLQARTGVYFIKATDYAGNQSAVATEGITTIPNLFDLNIIETMNEAPTFVGVYTDIELLGEAVVLQEQVPGDVNNVVYYPEGFYEFADLLDLDDIYSVRLQSQIRADGLRKDELMSEWVHLYDILHLNTALSSDWNVALQYRATDIFAAMSEWIHLSDIDHINFGSGVGFTAYRDIPTTGDATGRIFQFRIKLQSLTANVTPRLFDATVKADMPDRIDSLENLVSSATLDTTVTYDPVFKGPGTTPNVQMSVDNAQSGDYWVFGTKTLEGFTIRFYDKNDVQVSRQFDVVAKGFGHRGTSSI